MFQFQPPLPNKPPPKLSKFAAAAGKKMRKLRRNWSLKKNDISRSLSRIRRTSFAAGPGGLPGHHPAGGGAGGMGGLEMRRAARKAKAAGARSREGTLLAAHHHGGHGVHRGPSFKASSVVQSDEATMFYITLNIEDVNDGGGGDAGGDAAHVDEGSCEFN